jgi:hypothetical protein
VLDVTDSVPPEPVAGFNRALRDAAVQALEDAVLSRFRSAVGPGFREPVPTSSDGWDTYTLGPNLRVCDQFCQQLFIAGLRQKLEVLDDAGRTVESVTSSNGAFVGWTRNVYDNVGNLHRRVEIAFGDSPRVHIYEIGAKGFESAVEATFYEGCGTHVDVTKRASNGEWVQGQYDNVKKYAFAESFHDRAIAADYGDTQRLDELMLVAERPTEPDYAIRGPSSFQDANAHAYRGDTELPWNASAEECATWDRKVYLFHRRGQNIAGATMTVRRGDGDSVMVEHPGRLTAVKTEPGRVELPLTFSFADEILPALMTKAFG